ncbi:MAG TPA: hypothetical protein VFI70_01420 [Nitrososphaeraceae archaeon]|nr:hypothetical protein [Nitrososphaeraceae archaeon]
MGLTVTDILESISDEKALGLFKTIALTKPDSEILITKTQLSRKQYYSRMSVLMRSGLVKRNKSRYALTAFGKVIYDIEITIEIALENLWKLRAVDLVQVEEALSKEEQTRILDTNRQCEDKGRTSCQDKLILFRQECVSKDKEGEMDL